jgi:hypothetical protein
VGNILRRDDIAPAPKRSQMTTWKEFVRRHMDVLAGTGFFTVEVLTRRGLVTVLLSPKLCPGRGIDQIACLGTHKSAGV